MNTKPSEETSLDIPSYDEICRGPADSEDDEESFQKYRRQQRFALTKKKEADLSNVKIKTLAEIRAEKREREQKQLDCDAADLEISSTNAEVSSTSKMEEMDSDAIGKENSESKGVKRKGCGSEEVVRKRPKLRRPQITDSDNTVSSVESEKDAKSGDNTKRENRVDSSKLDEMLLLDEDDFEGTNVSLQAEEDLLKDIDELLSE